MQLPPLFVPRFLHLLSSSIPFSIASLGHIFFLHFMSLSLPSSFCPSFSMYIIPFLHSFSFFYSLLPQFLTFHIPLIFLFLLSFFSPSPSLILFTLSSFIVSSFTFIFYLLIPPSRPLYPFLPLHFLSPTSFHSFISIFFLCLSSSSITPLFFTSFTPLLSSFHHPLVSHPSMISSAREEQVALLCCAPRWLPAQSRHR